MRILYMAGLDSLGDDNSDDDNARYVAAVLMALNEEFSDADVVVGLGEHSVVEVTDVDASDDGDDVREEVMMIAGKVWDDADY